MGFLSKIFTSNMCAAIIFSALLFGGAPEGADYGGLLPSPVFANTVCETPVYVTRGGGKALLTLKADETVEILRDYSEDWYSVAAINGAGKALGWVRAQALRIPEDTATDESVIPPEYLTREINRRGYISDTDWLLYTDLARQIVYVFTREAKGWAFERLFVCATGKNASPTTRGIFSVCERGGWFYSERLGSGGKYWVRFNGSFLFHSVAMNEDKEITDPRVGTRVSSGCVRLSVEDAKWLYDNIPDKTAVVVF